MFSLCYIFLLNINFIFLFFMTFRKMRMERLFLRSNDIYGQRISIKHKKCMFLTFKIYVLNLVSCIYFHVSVQYALGVLQWKVINRDCRSFPLIYHFADNFFPLQGLRLCVCLESIISMGMHMCDMVSP